MSYFPVVADGGGDRRPTFLPIS